MCVCVCVCVRVRLCVRVCVCVCACVCEGEDKYDVKYFRVAQVRSFAAANLSLSTRARARNLGIYFRLSKTHNLTIPGLLFSRSTSPTFLRFLHPKSLEFAICDSLRQLKILPTTDPLPHMIHLPPKNREKAYRNLMRRTISDI